jgi:hypothetical protein
MRSYLRNYRLLRNAYQDEKTPDSIVPTQKDVKPAKTSLSKKTQRLRTSEQTVLAGESRRLIGPSRGDPRLRFDVFETQCRVENIRRNLDSKMEIQQPNPSQFEPDQKLIWAFYRYDTGITDARLCPRIIFQNSNSGFRPQGPPQEDYELVIRRVIDGPFRK